MCPIWAGVRLAPTAVHLAVATAYLGSSSSGSDGRPCGRGDGTHVCMTHDDPASSLVRCQFGFLYLAVCLERVLCSVLPLTHVAALEWTPHARLCVTVSFLTVPFANSAALPSLCISEC